MTAHRREKASSKIRPFSDHVEVAIRDDDGHLPTNAWFRGLGFRGIDSRSSLKPTAPFSSHHPKRIPALLLNLFFPQVQNPETRGRTSLDSEILATFVGTAPKPHVGAFIIN